jgi:hypothetical protein
MTHRLASKPGLLTATGQGAEPNQVDLKAVGVMRLGIEGHARQAAPTPHF